MSIGIEGHAAAIPAYQLDSFFAIDGLMLLLHIDN
jgi:hypothetical protein